MDIGKIRRLYAGEEIPVSENESWRMEGAREEAKADAPVPLPIHRFELQRLARRSAIPPPRFHYRFRAAEIAWQAAEQLPDNHPALAYIYNTAGSWLKYRDPQSADRFYKAMVWRNLKTDHGLEADRKRWFINIPAPAAHRLGPRSVLRRSSSTWPVGCATQTIPRHGVDVVSAASRRRGHQGVRQMRGWTLAARCLIMRLVSGMPWARMCCIGVHCAGVHGV